MVNGVSLGGFIKAITSLTNERDNEADKNGFFPKTQPQRLSLISPWAQLRIC